MTLEPIPRDHIVRRHVADHGDADPSVLATELMAYGRERVKILKRRL